MDFSTLEKFLQEQIKVGGKPELLVTPFPLCETKARSPYRHHRSHLSKWYITIFILRNLQVSDQIYLRKYNLRDWLCVIALNNDKDRFLPVPRNKCLAFFLCLLKRIDVSLRFRPAGIDIVTGWGRYFRVTATAIVRQTVEELLYIFGSAFFMEIENSDCLVVCGESLIALV
ncbi:hypothetical protein IGI04_006635 [Brassica rapa subsp. trilocularis]|uniref:Uncharacterized protein n=1 Tax=Brassica rapa subsp. trilocularis TaxID=1813537 RepID=A0ABQ7NJL2_BRACM|nr:hypothetical protein IGI04_006635 [Brassica rapa subsp. trilocularis]